MRPTLAVTSLLTLALLLVAAVQENCLTEWRVHQRAYRSVLVAKAQDEGERALARRFPFEVRQIVAPDLPAVDRCVSCHLGIDDPRMKDAPQPLRAHPGSALEAHDIDRLGCTACHGGQGRATTREEAHADEREVYWERGLLPRPLLQASCGACHDPSAIGDRGAPVLAKGRELLLEKGCLGCHKLDGRGGVLGPALDRVAEQARRALPFAHVQGERTVANWHRQHLLDPAKVVPGSKMPKVALLGGEVEALTTYLLSLRSTNLKERITPRDKHEERYRRFHPEPTSGAALYGAYCVDCHGDGVETLIHDTLKVGVPSVRNPDFLAVASEELLLRSIRDGRPGTDMPPWGGPGGLSEDEIRRLVAFLLQARQQTVAVAFRPSPRADAPSGKRLFEEHCAQCHGLTQGAGEAPWLGGPGFQATYGDALIGHTIQHGRSGTLMIPFGKDAGGDLSDQEISDLIAFVRTLGSAREGQ